MTDFRDTTVDRIINVDGTFNVTIQYVVLQFREYDETINATYRLSFGYPFNRLESNKTSSDSFFNYYHIFDKYVDINRDPMPSICPSHNEIYYAKRDTIAVHKKAYIEATASGINNQSMILDFIISSPFYIYLEDTGYQYYTIMPTVIPNGDDEYKVVFKIQGIPYSPGTTISFTQNMILYKDSSCTQEITSTPILFQITNTGTPIGD